MPQCQIGTRKNKRNQMAWLKKYGVGGRGQFAKYGRVAQGRHL